MPSIFDHIVLLVKDLAVAVKDYEALGFTVLERADTAHGSTSFRFVSFEDGSYILLTQFRDEAAMEKHRLGPLMKTGGEGLADYSFTVADAHGLKAKLAAAGRPVGGPVEVSNVLADGRTWGLDLLMAGTGCGGDAALPFVVQDRMGRANRIPGPSKHANGARGILGLRVTTPAPDIVADTLDLLLEGKAKRSTSTHQGKPSTIMDSGAGWIEIVPVKAGDWTPGRKGGGQLELVVATNDRSAGPEGRLLDLKLAHGAPIRLVA
jgi:catechol 2,3-dioxygenase-like lactoylglutathione lyase family enzyme